MKNIIKIFTLFITVTGIIFPQTILDDYIQRGLDNNLALKQMEFSLKQSIAALDEARGLFFPNVSINARYTRSGGGRTIDFPVGDLMNPVYQTLNQILGQSRFPVIENEQIKFLREEEQETKISLVQPIFQPEVFYNYKIKSDLTKVQKAERNVYARALIADIKSAYYNYLITENILTLINSTEDILNENLRVSKSLYKNDKATVEVVYRAEAELSKLIQQKEDAAKNMEVAKAYFNFLLNREQTAEIKIDNSTENFPTLNFSMEEAINSAITNREEIAQIASAGMAADNSTALSKSRFLPNILLAADYGFQGEKYKFTNQDDFWTASLVLQWNLFRGFQDNAKIEQAEFAKKKLEAQKIEIENKIRMQVREAYLNLEVAHKSISAAKAQMISANKSFEIIDKKYREGIASQIEFIDARATKTNAEINNIVTKFEFLKNYAELERVTAVSPNMK